MGSDIQEKLLKNFPFTPTSDQEKLMTVVNDFFNDKTQRKCFILKGYAGTGKTSFIKTLVKTLPDVGFSFQLLAPTGRAAKVISEYTGVQAFTIHKAIYDINPSKDGMLKFNLSKNEDERKVFIVDEASMISSGTDKSLLLGRNILDDLFEFVYAKKNCSVIFIGDTAQLPPVGEQLSSALNSEFIQKEYNMKMYVSELKEVLRQANDSGILMNATSLRILIGRSASEPVLKSNGFKDVEHLMGESITDNLQEHYNGKDADESLIVCRSNKQANKYNAYIRSRLLGFDQSLCSGDRMMVVKNNYFWLEESSTTGFIANGDIIQIKKVLGTEKKFGFEFADAIINFLDYPKEGDLEVKLLLNTINSEAPSLSQEDQKKLFDEVFNSYSNKMKAGFRLKKTYSDPYFNALQVKFSYAVTCHKAQGGQWPTVFVDAGFMKDDMYNTEYLRWLYTAVTRATDKLLLVNFEERFFKK